MADQGGATATNFEVPELHEDRNLNSFGSNQRMSPLPTPSLVASTDRRLLAPMPGLIVRCEMTLGEEVEIGDTVLLLEAMKMENPITAPISGKIISICNEGEKVRKGDVLAVIR